MICWKKGERKTKATLNLCMYLSTPPQPSLQKNLNVNTKQKIHRKCKNIPVVSSRNLVLWIHVSTRDSNWKSSPSYWTRFPKTGSRRPLIGGEEARRASHWMRNNGEETPLPTFLYFARQLSYKYEFFYHKIQNQHICINYYYLFASFSLEALYNQNN